MGLVPLGDGFAGVDGIATPGAGCAGAAGVATPGGGLLVVAMGCTGCRTTSGVGGRTGGERYQTGNPKVKPGRLRVAMTRELTTPEGGKRKGIVCMGVAPMWLGTKGGCGNNGG